MQYLPNSRKGGQNFYLAHLMIDKTFDRLGLSKTRIHLQSLLYDIRIPRRFQGHYMKQQLDYISACNQHDLLSGAYQYGGTD